MKPLIRWSELDESLTDHVAVIRTGLQTAEIVTPFALAEDENGEVVVACLINRVCVNVNGGSKSMPWMRLMLPGICGHYECGGAVEVCLN
jgi:hypothetical protein